MERDLRAILAAALEAADPGAAVRRFLRVEGDAIVVGERRIASRRVVVLAVGKAATPMALAAHEILGERIDGGLVVTKKGYETSPLSCGQGERAGPSDPRLGSEGPVSHGAGVRGDEIGVFDTIVAGHPVPNTGSLEAARRVAEVAASLDEGDLLLALLSGGASALLADPAGDITLADLSTLSQDLLRSGAAIGEMNAVRKHLSTLKGGGLARLAAPAAVAALLLSDVVGDDPSTIGSGPTVPDPTTLADVTAVLRRYAITPPARVARYLDSAPETLKRGDAVFDRVTNTVIGSGRLSATAAATKARELGYTPLILSTLITGAAREAAGLHTAIVREALETGHPLPPPCALISGGETTVVVRGAGLGGPNQEFALALAVELDGVSGWAALAVDTDGSDGPTDAAGGLVTGATAEAIRAAGADPVAALDANDAYPALHAGGALLTTGPTGTNVNDLRVILIEACSSRGAALTPNPSP